MLFAITARDVPDSLPARLQARPAHLERLQLLHAAGCLQLAGPFPLAEAEGFSGSLIVAEFASLAEAEAWAAADPYVSAGVYASVDIRPFRKVFPQ